MSGGISGIDHLVFKVRDLDRAREVYGRLGFSLTPPARHPGLGTANHTAVFADRTYIEFLAVEHPDEVGSPFDVIATDREGLVAVALRTSDARDLHHTLIAQGEKPGGPVSFARPVELPDGMAEARFTATPLAAGTLPGVAAFACEQHTPDYVWQSGYLGHENGAIGISVVVVVAESSAEVAEKYAGVFRSTAVAGLADTYTVKVGSVRILVGPPAVMRWIWSADPLLNAETPFVGGVVVLVEDLHRAQQALQKSRMSTIGSAGVLRVISQHTLGVMMAFSADFDLERLLP